MAKTKTVHTRTNDKSVSTKASSKGRKRRQLVTTTTDTTEDNTSKKTNEVYSPDWSQEIEYYNKYAADDGYGRKEAKRHLVALRAGINRKHDDLEERKQLLASVSPKSANQLHYMNPSSRLLWLGAALNGFKTLNPKGPFYAVTLLADGWNRTTADEGNGTKAVKDTVKALLADLKAHGFLHVETAVFPKIKIEADGHHSAAHVQGLVWGVSGNDLRKTLKPHFPPLEDGTKGYWVETVTDRFAYVLSYSTKAPTYGYSAWPVGDGGKMHKSVRLSLTAHDQLVTQFGGTTWPAVNIATGDGMKVRQNAIDEIGYKSSKVKSPLADKSTVTEAPPLPLTLENGVDPSLKIDAGERKLPSLAAEVSVDLGKSLGQEEKSRERLYGSLEGVYRFALTSADREHELKKVLKTKGITFNSAADLFLLSVKIAAAKKDVDKRRVSDWAASLRYLYSKRCKPESVATTVKEYGGIKECVKALKSANTPKAPKEDKTPDLTVDEAWKIIRKHGRNRLTVSANRIDIPSGKKVFFGGRNKEKNTLYARHVISVSDKLAEEFLLKVAKSLTAKSAKTKKAAD